ncbi:MAG: hypothetical protein AABP62_25075 [Planctomycetota bacterium]
MSLLLLYVAESHGVVMALAILAAGILANLIVPANRMSAAGLQASDIKLDLNDVRARLEEIRHLRDGWMDGKGVAPSNAGVNWFTKTFEAHYSVDLPQPFIYPTVEGGLQLEWSLGEHELSLEVDLTHHTGDWHRLHLRTQQDDTRTINLGVDAEWKRLVDEIGQLAKELV